MIKAIKLITTIITLTSIISCNKENFLNKKPSSTISTPTTLTDFQNLLDNTTVLNYTGALGQISSDEYIVSDVNYGTGTATERNSYIWAKDIYNGDVNIQSWNVPYQQVFYANNVLASLAKSDSASSVQGQYIKGWALFTRGFAFYELTRTFCKAYDVSTASSDLGIPLKIKPGIDDIEQRSTLQKTFDQILSDLNIAGTLLPSIRPAANLNRPSQIAVFALLARINLDMRNYSDAEMNTEKALALYSKLIDYNTISKTSTTPFTSTNDELIYNTRQVPTYNSTLNSSGSIGKIPANIISSYASNDLRLSVYFGKGADGSYYRKRGYYGSGLYSFTGLATDELYLIKAECLARLGQKDKAMDALNSLLVKRYPSGAFTPSNAATTDVALNLILSERSKELVWRGLRWYDLKRLNKEGANITLTRTILGVTYTLTPNNPRWVLPIPDDEIALSGITQNLR